MAKVSQFLPLPSREEVAQLLSRPKSPTGVHKYQILFSIGHGTFGRVFSALTSSGQRVAIKCVPQDPDFKNRELSILKELDSPFTLRLYDYFLTQPTDSKIPILNIVTDVFPNSLSNFMQELHLYQQEFDPLLRKLWIYQLFCGLDYIHSIGITHRDIKPGNILVNPLSGELKICDFGSAKVLTGRNQKEIASLHYRAPEILLGSEIYTNKIDIWAAGCVVAETFLDAMPIFQGIDNSDQFVQIVHLIGNPTQDEIKSYHLDKEIKLKEEKIFDLETALPERFDPDLLNLLRQIFVFNPKNRPSARDCMKSPYFRDLFQPGLKLPNGIPIPNLPK